LKFTLFAFSYLVIALTFIQILYGFHIIIFTLLVPCIVGLLFHASLYRFLKTHKNIDFDLNLK
jgi:hypothetical protein